MKQKGKMSGKKLKQMFVTYTFVLPDFIGLLVFIIILKCIFNFQLARVNSSLIEITSAHIYCH